jgi:hypothetical protein
MIEKSAFHATSAGRTKRKRTTTIVHRRNPLGGEYSISSRKKQRRKRARHPEAGIFYQ